MTPQEGGQTFQKSGQSAEIGKKLIKAGEDCASAAHRAMLLWLVAVTTVFLTHILPIPLLLRPAIEAKERISVAGATKASIPDASVRQLLDNLGARGKRSKPIVKDNSPNSRTNASRQSLML